MTNFFSLTKVLFGLFGFFVTLEIGGAAYIHKCGLYTSLYGTIFISSNFIHAFLSFFQSWGYITCYWVSDYYYVYFWKSRVAHIH